MSTAQRYGLLIVHSLTVKIFKVNSYTFQSKSMAWHCYHSNYVVHPIRVQIQHQVHLLWAVRYIKLAIPSTFERSLIYRIVSYRIVSYEGFKIQTAKVTFKVIQGTGNGAIR